jgi:prevent-host-death family protein
MKTVNIADLKKNLSFFIKEVQNGSQITINNRDIPVAYLTPIEKESSIIILKPRKNSKISKIKFRVPKLKLNLTFL